MDEMIEVLTEHGIEPVLAGVLQLNMGDTTLHDPSRADMLERVTVMLRSRTSEYADAA